MNYQKLKESIIALAGGQDNIKNVTHCATRLRLELQDESLFDQESINKLDGVVNTLKMGGQCQIIIGPNVKELYDEFAKTSPAGGCADKGIKLNIKEAFQTLFSFIGASVGFYIPALIGGGLVKALLTVLVQFNLLSATADTYVVLWFAADAVFQFLPIFVAIGVAKKMNASLPLAVWCAFVMISPTFVGYVTEGTALTIFGINIPLISYYSGFFPALLSTVIMAYLERLLKRVLPKAAGQLLIPLIIILVMTPVSLCVSGPLAQELGTLLAKPLIAIADYQWIVVTILGLIMPVMVMFGLHQAIFLFAFTVLLTTYGYDPLFMPASLCSHMAMGAVALGVFIKSKEIYTKQTALSSCATVWLGSISEPVIFGVLAQNKIALFAACIGGGAASLVGSLLGLKCYALAGSGFFHIPTFIGEESGWYAPVIACVISIAVAFTLVMLLYKDKEIAKN